MYFKVTNRKNPETNCFEGYFRLVESYRNLQNRICHRTLLNVGFLPNVTAEQLNLIQKILTEKVTNKSDPKLFEEPLSTDTIVLGLVQAFYHRMYLEKKIDVPEEKTKTNSTGKQWQTIDINSIKNKDIREVGTEWLSLQAINQLNIRSFLEQEQWSDDEIKLALIQIIARAAYPASEDKMCRWIAENSSVCELVGYEKAITRYDLYHMALKLYDIKDKMEIYLSVKTNKLFDLEDRIVFYDLTNFYFEGDKRHSIIAKHGRSKEKRSDAKLVVLGLVINKQGFLKYSTILEGNMADSNTLLHMIETLRNTTRNSSESKGLVVFDAGLAGADNLAAVKAAGYDYLCVTRSTMKEYELKKGVQTVLVKDNKNQEIKLTRVASNKSSDCFLKIQSPAKELKEQSMNAQFLARFEEGLQNINDSLSKKGGVKEVNAVNQRIGRILQKYPSIQKYFKIIVTTEKRSIDASTNKNNKNKSEPKKEVEYVTSVTWQLKEGVDINGRCGIYFLQTSLNNENEKFLWDAYNTIREIEATFRILKNDLDLRPIYHKNDDAVMAHLNLGLLAYWVVNTIRYQLKKADIKSDWKEIIRVMSTQKIVTTEAQNNKDEIILIRRCSEPCEKVRTIYQALNYKEEPFKRKVKIKNKEMINTS